MDFRHQPKCRRTQRKVSFAPSLSPGIVFFLQGRESSKDEIGASALLAKEVDDKLNGAAVQVQRLPQYAHTNAVVFYTEPIVFPTANENLRLSLFVMFALHGTVRFAWYKERNPSTCKTLLCYRYSLFCIEIYTVFSPAARKGMFSPFRSTLFHT